MGRSARAAVKSAAAAKSDAAGTYTVLIGSLTDDATGVVTPVAADDPMNTDSNGARRALRWDRWVPVEAPLAAHSRRLPAAAASGTTASFVFLIPATTVPGDSGNGSAVVAAQVAAAALLSNALNASLTDGSFNSSLVGALATTAASLHLTVGSLSSDASTTDLSVTVTNSRLPPSPTPDTRLPGATIFGIATGAVGVIGLCLLAVALWLAATHKAACRRVCYRPPRATPWEIVMPGAPTPVAYDPALVAAVAARGHAGAIVRQQAGRGAGAGAGLELTPITEEAGTGNNDDKKVKKKKKKRRDRDAADERDAGAAAGGGGTIV